MTPTTKREREAEALLRAEYEAAGRVYLGDSRAIRAIMKALTREQREGVTDEMVARFLGWKLPADFAPDCGITFEPVGNKGTRFEYRFEPVGTNLLTAVQAREMLEYVLATGAPTAQQPLDGPANNAGVATGSRNGPPSESVTRGNLPPSIPQQEAPGAVAGWSEAEQRATLVNSLRASKSWMTGYAEAFVDAFQDHARTTQPAPVDVRALRALAETAPAREVLLPNGTTVRTVEIIESDILALLDGQPAGVDWRGHFVSTTEARYRDAGMKVEQARIHAENDARELESMHHAALGGGVRS